MTISQNAARARKILTSGTLAREKVSNSAYKTPPLVRYRRCASIGKCCSVPRLVRCPEFGGCPLFGSCKCIASTGIAVGTSTVVRYSGDVRYWECPLSEVPLYTILFVCSTHFLRCIILLVMWGQGRPEGMLSSTPQK